MKNSTVLIFSLRKVYFGYQILQGFQLIFGIAVQEAIQNLDNNIQDYRSSENYGKSYFQNVMDYNVKNKHFDVTLSSKDTIISYLKDIIYDIQRTFNIWTLSLKLELKGDAVIRQFSDACQKFLSVKNIGKKL